MGGVAPSVVIGTVQTDLSKLGEQIHLPAPPLNARWVIARKSDRGPLPSPGTAFLIARVEMPPNVIQRLLSESEWAADAEPDELFARVQMNHDGHLRVLSGQSKGISVVIRKGFFVVL